MVEIKFLERSSMGWGPQFSMPSGPAAPSSPQFSKAGAAASSATPNTTEKKPMTEREKVLARVENFDRYPPTRLGRACDFSESNKLRMQMVNQRMAEMNRALIKAPTVNAEDDGYALVDTKTGQKAMKKSKAIKQTPFGQQKHNQVTNFNYQSGILSTKGAYLTKGQMKGQGKAMAAAKGKGKGKKGKKGQQQQQNRMADWSVVVRNEWEVVQEFGLNSMPKMIVDPKAQIKKEDLRWCGRLYNYNKAFDKINARKPQRLPIAEHIQFFNPPASEDEQLQDLMGENEDVQVFATEQVLGCIMAASRSVYSWDVVITKSGDKVLIDKREGTTVDFLTVSETGDCPPQPDDTINGADKLGKEATRINQNFSQATVDYEAGPSAKTPEGSMIEPHPFVETEEEMDSVSANVYRYRKITIPGNKKSDDAAASEDLQIIVRCEVSAKLDDGTDRCVSVKSLHDVGKLIVPEQQPGQPPRKINALDWKEMLGPGGKQGLVLATEIKNNSFKFARWVAQCWLSGCEVLKLGYMTRQNADNAFKHEVMKVQTHMISNLADQSSFKEHNAFGVLRNIVDTVRRQDDELAKFVLVKDPTKPVLRLYQVPLETFEGDDYDEEEEEDDDDDFVE